MSVQSIYTWYYYVLSSVSTPGLILSHEITSILLKGSCSGSNFSCENVAARWASTTADGDCFGLNWLLVSFCFTSVVEVKVSTTPTM